MVTDMLMFFADISEFCYTYTNIVGYMLRLGLIHVYYISPRLWSWGNWYLDGTTFSRAKPTGNQRPFADFCRLSHLEQERKPAWAILKLDLNSPWLHWWNVDSWVTVRRQIGVSSVLSLLDWCMWCSVDLHGYSLIIYSRPGSCQQEDT